MRSKEFIRDSALDDMVAQAGTKPTPPPGRQYNQSKVGDWIGGTAQPTTMLGKATNTISPTNILNKASGVANGFTNAWQAGAGGGPGGTSVAYKGRPGEQNQQQQQQPAGNQPIDDKKIANYLKQASKNMPLKQNTGNQGIDTLLKNAGLLK
jgi:hypothetical protein